MNLYRKPEWAVRQIIREDGLVEDLCKHNIGHPNLDWLRENDPDGEFKYSIHGCDGCCDKHIKKLIDKRYKI